MKKFALCLPIVATIYTGSSFASLFDKVNDYVETNKDIIQLNSGTAIAVIKDDKVIYEGYFGYADIQKQIPVDHNTTFYIASITKAFYSLLTLQKEHEGQLDTQSTLASLLPDITFKPALHSDEITIQNLLSHTSGIDNWPLIQVTAYTGQHDNKVIEQILNDSQVNDDAPLGQFAYTNVGYNILSYWMDGAFASDWQTQLADNIFKPLGMTHTSARISDVTDGGWQLAKGYSVKSVHPNLPVYLTKTDNSMHAAGGMISTAQDLARFLIMHVNQGKLDGTQIFPESVIKKSHQSLITHTMFGSEQEYGWGWFMRDIFGHRLLEHRGGYSGASTYVSFIPEQKVGLVVLSNQDKWGGDLAYALEMLAYGIALGKSEDEIDGYIEKYQTFAQQQADKFYANKPTAVPSMATNIDANFVGNYHHNTLGDIQVQALPEGGYELLWGNLRSRLLKGNESSTLKVEFVPNSLDDIAFLRGSDNKVHIQYRDYTFTKTNLAI